VNLPEAGATNVTQALLEAGVGIEAGVWSVEDTDPLAATGLGRMDTRILIEPVAVSRASALRVIEDIHRARGRLGLTAPRAQPGDGEAT
jgi:hypothetical protein